MLARSVNFWTRTVVASTVALGVATGVGSCDNNDRSGSSNDAFCADEVTFQGIDYTASGPTGGPPPGLPADVVRGHHIGRIKRCIGERGVDAEGSPVVPKTVWLEVYEIKGLPRTDGIFVESFGPMAPLTTPNSAG